MTTVPPSVAPVAETTTPQPSVAPATAAPVVVEEGSCIPRFATTALKEEFIAFAYVDDMAQLDFDNATVVTIIDEVAQRVYNGLVECEQEGATRTIHDAVLEGLNTTIDSFLLRVGTFCNSCGGFLECPEDGVDLFLDTAVEEDPPLSEDTCQCDGPDVEEYADAVQTALQLFFPDVEITSAVQLCAIDGCIPEPVSTETTFDYENGVCLGTVELLSASPSEFPSEYPSET